MAYASLNAWQELAQINTNIAALERGSPAFKASEARAAIAERPGVELTDDTEPEEYVDEELAELFVEGRLGEAKESPHEAPLSELLGAAIASEQLGISEKAENLRRVGVSASRTGTHVRAQQTVDGLPVCGSDLVMHFDAYGRPYSLTGRVFPEALGGKLDRPEKAHPDPAGIVAAALGVELDIESSRVSEIALWRDDQFVACSEVRAASDQPFADWLAIVSFHGELLMVHNVACAHHGEARVYLGNPERDTSAVPQRLDSCGAGPPVSLAGDFVSVSKPGGSPISSPHGAFLFGDEDPEFDEPNLYFVLDQARKQFELLNARAFSDPPLLGGSNFNPISAYVHHPDAVGNAFYRPIDGSLYFGDVDDRSTARSRDIAIHEFTHAVSDAICGLGQTMPHTQSRAMSEGYSDYFACSMLDHPVMGDYFVGDPAGFRSCANDRDFPSGFAGTEHDVGEVWAGFLWSLREHEEIGKSIADSLALNSLYSLGPYRTIHQGLRAVLAADRKLFPTGEGQAGRHEALIQEAFDARSPF